MRIIEKALGPEHLKIAGPLQHLAFLYGIQRRFMEAERHYQRSLRILEKALGPEHPTVATVLNNLAFLYKMQGRYADGEPFYQRSLRIYEKALGPEHPEIADELDSLASLYKMQGRYAEAEAYYQRSLRIYEKALGPDHFEVASATNNLAGLYHQKGQYSEAESHYQRSLRIYEKAQVPDHPVAILVLNNLAVLYAAGDKPSEAIPILSRLLERSLRRNGVYSELSLRAVKEMTTVQQHLGQSLDASVVYERLLADIMLGPRAGQSVTPEVAEALAKLIERGFWQAWLARRFDVAERIHAQVRGLPLAKETPVAAALTRMGRQLSDTSAGVRKLLASHAVFAKGHDDAHALRLFGRAFEEATQEHPEEAARFLTEGLYLGEQHLRRQKSVRGVSAWLDQERPYLDLIFELARRQPKSVQLLHLAWMATLVSKGRALDAETRALRVLRSPQLTKLHAARMERQNRLAGQAHRMSLSGQSGVELRDVQAQRMQTMELMLESIDEMRIETLPEPFELVRSVSATVPKDGMLVDYVEYTPPRLSPEDADVPRYLALLLYPGERAEVLDLGEVRSHEPALKRLILELRDRKSDPRASAQEVYRRLLAPVLKATGAARQVFLSPDGALNLIQFDALHDGKQYLIDSAYTLRYLTSGRDRIRSYGAAPGR